MEPNRLRRQFSSYIIPLWLKTGGAPVFEDPTAKKVFTMEMTNSEHWQLSSFAKTYGLSMAAVMRIGFRQLASSVAAENTPQPIKLFAQEGAATEGDET